MSNIKFFRDIYKNPDIYGGGPDKKELEEIKEYNEKSPKHECCDSEKKLLPIAQKYYEAINIIKSGGLKPGVIDDKEKQVIESRKKIILDYSSKVLEDIKNYLSQVNALELQKISSYSSVEQYQSAISESDGMRRNYHNNLIADLKILIRLININFNRDFPEDLRLKLEAELRDRKGIAPEQLKELMAKREYSEFPYKNGIFLDMSKSPRDPQGEREYIADWAFKIYTDLTVLTNKILD